jgi:hypothetical protein
VAPRSGTGRDPAGHRSAHGGAERRPRRDLDPRPAHPMGQCLTRPAFGLLVATGACATGGPRYRRHPRARPSRVFGHGRAFWTLVASRRPDHAQWRRWLREHALELHGALGQDEEVAEASA